jgi:hypothetical protein
MAGQEASAPQIEPALKTAQPTVGARIGERLIPVVDLLAEEARPIGPTPTCARAAGIVLCQRVADALVQSAERVETKLPRDRPPLL